jgi:DNA-binding response OmpR family regulator
MGQGPVLVVDDEPDFAALLSDVLESEGYRVLTATNGMQGLGILIMERPNVVILDLDMPVVDGVSFAKSAQTYGVSPPIILMTGYSEVPQWARLVGAIGYLQKPFEFSELIRLVSSVFKQA